ncbi:translation initiation factor IF-2 subunit alpha [Candidatus Woesearchaeota archaeon]|nr:translation initiation factor IF-2 subunit alpha [Candidatus Woesearchaeota archaeon]
MLLKKEGFPEEDELVMCTVTKVQFHSVFVNLDEYNKGGMIHISEVSPGRIRNIRDFVKETKKVVCKVLRINSDRGHIDLSLRRVTDGQRRKKVDELKQQQKSEKILEFVARDLKLDGKKFFLDVSKTVLEKYDSLYDFFQSVVTEDVIKDAKLDAKTEKVLEEAIKSRIKEVSVNIEGKLKLTSYDGEGIEVVKEALKKAEAKGMNSVSIKYLGAGTYGISVEAKDYKQAEKIVKDATEAAIDHVSKHDGSGEFVRAES